MGVLCVDRWKDYDTRLMLSECCEESKLNKFVARYYPQVMLKSVETIPRYHCEINDLLLVELRSMPVREQSSDTGISLDKNAASGSISSYPILSTCQYQRDCLLDKVCMTCQWQRRRNNTRKLHQDRLDELHSRMQEWSLV